MRTHTNWSRQEPRGRCGRALEQKKDSRKIYGSRMAHRDRECERHCLRARVCCINMWRGVFWAHTAPFPYKHLYTLSSVQAPHTHTHTHTIHPVSIVSMFRFLPHLAFSTVKWTVDSVLCIFLYNVMYNTHKIHGMCCCLLLLVLLEANFTNEQRRRVVGLWW